MRKNVPADSEFLFRDLPKRVTNVTANENLFSTSKTPFNHITPLLEVQKTCIDSLKTVGIATKMVTKTEPVNTRNDTAATAATNILNKRSIEIGRSS